MPIVYLSTEVAVLIHVHVRAYLYQYLSGSIGRLMLFFSLPFDWRVCPGLLLAPLVPQYSTLFSLSECSLCFLVWRHIRIVRHYGIAVVRRVSLSLSFCIVLKLIYLYFALSLFLVLLRSSG